MTQQTEAQRLAGVLVTPDLDVTTRLEARVDAANLLLRQDELLVLALEALEVSFPIVQHERFVQDASYGRNFSQTKTDRARTAHDKTKETIATIREHREAK